MTSWKGHAHVSVISLASSEKSFKGVVSGDDETSKVGEELSGNVEEDGEEVESSNTKDQVDLGDGGLLLKVVEEVVLGELERMSASFGHLLHY